MGKVREYRGCTIHPAGSNTSGIRWWALTPSGQVRADTLEEAKRLIREVLLRTLEGK